MLNTVMSFRLFLASKAPRTININVITAIKKYSGLNPRRASFLEMSISTENKTM